jgi:hypothetical protein
MESDMPRTTIDSMSKDINLINHSDKLKDFITQDFLSNINSTQNANTLNVLNQVFMQIAQEKQATGDAFYNMPQHA